MVIIFGVLGKVNRLAELVRYFTKRLLESNRNSRTEWPWILYTDV